MHVFFKCLEKLSTNVGCFLVPEVPKKPVPEEKVPVAVPKKPERPPAKGMPHFLKKQAIFLLISERKSIQVTILHVHIT